MLRICSPSAMGEAVTYTKQKVVERSEEGKLIFMTDLNIGSVTFERGVLGNIVDIYLQVLSVDLDLSERNNRIERLLAATYCHLHSVQTEIRYLNHHMHAFYVKETSHCLPAQCLHH